MAKIENKTDAPESQDAKTAEASAVEKREALILKKMRDANMTRENAELVLKHQEESDAARTKKK